ncbi:MAG: AAA family ATPase, partial [Sphingobium sp.]|nr:AAA family ATPase [Sphingobium sp.]
SLSQLFDFLGVVPDSPQFRHHADNPLPFDIVVVDEASMVDLPLMCKLAEAVADGAQLVLLGDPDQLPSVEAGDVLAAILAAAGDGGALDDDDARALQPLLGGAATASAPAAVVSAAPAASASAQPHTGDLFATAVDAVAWTGAAGAAPAASASAATARADAHAPGFHAARIHLV